MTTHSQRALILYNRRRFINYLLTYLLTYLLRPIDIGYDYAVQWNIEFPQKNKAATFGGNSPFVAVRLGDAALGWVGQCEVSWLLFSKPFLGSRQNQMYW